MTPDDFIKRWKDSGGAELANSQSFLKELCALLDVPQPEPTQSDETQNRYVFEKAVEFNNGDGTTSSGRVDLYRAGCFVLESKQGVERKAAEQAEALATVTKSKKFKAGTAPRGTPAWEHAMVKARQQAKRYAEALPDEWPPILVVVDIGYCIDIYADFTCTGKHYIPFPDPQSYRIRLAQLTEDSIRDTLRAIWLDPSSIDPTKQTAKITREVAERLAKLALSLELDHSPEIVAQFLMRCLFTMFAEDVEIGGLTQGVFTRFLESRRGKLNSFVPMLSQLWREMDTGGFSVIVDSHLKQFNGGLFGDQTALPVTDDQLELLIEASVAKWENVEPAIFGRLLERALDPIERHQLGAHYTPRDYVERLVLPTIVEPLREEWDTAFASAASLYEQGKTELAVRELRGFHEHLCNVTVLDPACGSGNFLYVALEHLKRLEGEVLNTLSRFDHTASPTLTVDPHQFLGIEVNPRAAAITDLVLWIGYLQWHVRSRGTKALNEPIIRKFQNVECRDALLKWDRIEIARDKEGSAITRWDGRTKKMHPATGEKVPDESARTPELRYINPRQAKWPEADFIVGNPPYLGVRNMRSTIGNGYVDALTKTYGDVPETCDYVMYWWHKAALLLETKKSQRFGFITTNSITQAYSRPLLKHHLKAKSGIKLVFAIPKHPWVDESDGAAVNVSLTVAARSNDYRSDVKFGRYESDHSGARIIFETVKTIGPSLNPTIDVHSTAGLKANERVCFQGVIPGDKGFKLKRDDLAAAKIDPENLPPIIRRYIIGNDIVRKPVAKWVIDCFGIDCTTLQELWPFFYQHLYDRVKPNRDENPRPTRRENWWLFAENAPKMRRALAGLSRYIVTPNTAKYRPFVFVDSDILPDAMAYAIATEDAFVLGNLSSRVHRVWALAAGGTLETRPRYNSESTFSPFPFCDPDSSLREKIRRIGEKLDQHRKRQQKAHPELTLTAMYNVLEKLRSGTKLTEKEQRVHERGLITVLLQIHDELDSTVLQAYGWPADITDDEILIRLVALNRDRSNEELRGTVRWLRREFQTTVVSGQLQRQLETDSDDSHVAERSVAKKVKKEVWPKTIPERFRAVRATLQQQSSPATAKELASGFTRVRKEGIAEILETLVEVGQARRTDDGRYAP